MSQVTKEKNTKKKKKNISEIGLTKKQQEAMDKLHVFMKKQSKDLDFSLGSDLLANRVGRNGATPTSSLSVDLILGGGIPKHRLTVLSGPMHSGKTTLMQAALANQLLKGTLTHYLDFEGAADGSWMKNGTGVDFSKYAGKNFFPILDMPSGEDGFRYLIRTFDEAINLGLADLPELTHIVGLDSVPSLVPEELLEDDESGSKPYIAIMLSKWLPIVRSKLKAANASMIAINQIRSKVRVKNPYECVHAETPILFTDGRVFPIKEVVDKKIEGEIWSHQDGKLIPKKITNWFYNGESKPEDWVTLKTEGPGSGNGLYSVTVTYHHEVLTSTGWKQAQDVEEGESLFTKYERKFVPGSTAYQFLLGMLVGDSCIPQGRDNGILKLSDNVDPEYLDWKIKKLKPFVEFSEYPVSGRDNHSLFVSDVRQEFNVLKERLEKRNPLPMLDGMTPLSLAVWYMDDGSYNYHAYHDNATLSLGRFKGDENLFSKLSEFLNSLGYENSFCSDSGLIRFNKNGFAKLSKDISPYVPPCMQRKLRPEDREKYKEFELESPTEQVALPVTVTAKVRGLSNRKARELGKYDIEVGDTHNYMAGHGRGGLVIHNSPEYEPGGNAIQFLADLKVRFDTQKPYRVDDGDYSLVTKEAGLAIPRQGGLWEETNPDGSVDSYVYRKVKTLKNRVFSPFRETYIRICTSYKGGEGRGIDPVFDTLRFYEEIGYALWASKDTISLNGKSFSYWDLKKELENPGSDLRAEALDLMDSGKAFELYYNKFSGNLGKPDSEVSESEEEATDESDS